MITGSMLARTRAWAQRKLGIGRASSASRTQESRYRSLFNRVPMALYSSAPDGTILDVNPAMVELLGYPDRDSLMKLNAFDIFVDRGERQSQVDLIEHEDLVRGYELQLRRLDGTLIWVRDHARAVRDASGQVVFYEGALEDITERKRAQAALQRSNEKLRAVIEHSPLAIISQDLLGNVVSWNPAAERIFGWREQEILGSPLPVIVPEGEEESFQELRERLMRGQRLEEIEVRRKRRDGAVIDLSLSAGPLRDAHGHIVGTIGVIADITEHKKLTERLRQAQTMDAIGRLAGGIAHDFNNLLTAIIGNADLLLQSLEDDEALADVNEIKAASQRAAALTAHLLAFSRRKVMQLYPLDLNEMIADLGSRLKAMLDGSGIDLVTVLEGNLEQVKADPIQLEEIVICLVENASDAMPNGGRLTIETTQADLTPDESRALGLSEHGRHAVLSITDTGVGMDEETKSRIFEPFFSTKKEVKGTGLGLPMVYGIVKQSAGGIVVESQPGHGTTVKVYLPTFKRTTDARVSLAAATDTKRRDGATILVVEDEDSVRALAARVLRAEGFAVLEAGDGVEALRIVEEHGGPLDLLITDVVMPRLGGPELAKELLVWHPEARVIYTSGYTDNKSVREMVADSNTPFLQKPFTPTALLGIARRVLADS